MFAFKRRSNLQNRTLGWVLLAIVVVLPFVLFSLSLGLATIAAFTVVLSVVTASFVFLIKSKLAYQRRERELLSAGRLAGSMTVSLRS